MDLPAHTKMTSWFYAGRGEAKPIRAQPIRARPDEVGYFIFMQRNPANRIKVANAHGAVPVSFERLVFQSLAAPNNKNLQSPKSRQVVLWTAALTRKYLWLLLLLLSVLL